VSAEDERHDQDHADEHEALAALRRGGLPDRDRGRHHMGPHRNAKADHAKQEQRQCQRKGLSAASLRKAAQRDRRRQGRSQPALG